MNSNNMYPIPGQIKPRKQRLGSNSQSRGIIEPGRVQFPVTLTLTHRNLNSQNRNLNPKNIDPGTYRQVLNPKVRNLYPDKNMKSNNMYSLPGQIKPRKQRLGFNSQSRGIIEPGRLGFNSQSLLLSPTET